MEIRHVNLAKGYRGGERQTELLIRALGHMSVQQSLVCRDDSPMRENLSDVSPLQFISANSQLQGLFGYNKPDIVHAHEAKAVHWAWLYNLSSNVPYVLTRRLDNPVKDSWMNRRTYSSAACVVSISRVIMDAFQQKGLPHLARIPDSAACLDVNSQSVAEIKQQFEGKFVIGHVGALIDSHKGQRVLIEVARKLQSSHPNIHLLFLGEGYDEGLLQRESADLQNVSWLGFKLNVVDYIASFDLFVFPSRNEGFGSTLLDVMQQKVPIVASNVGGIPDVVLDNETGLLCQPGDTEAFYSSIVKLYDSPALRNELSSNALEALKQFLPENTAASYLQCYNASLKVC